MRTPQKAWRFDLGASIVSYGGVTFKVWAPKADAISVKIVSGGERVIELKKQGQGYFAETIEGVYTGDRYFFVLDQSGHYPDPASRFQPDGVHGPSGVIDPDEFLWDDHEWRGTALQEFVIYELHAGTFTAEGTFETIIPHLDYLTDLGITAVELMPVAQFPGNRNWGYDGVYPFAPQNTYGGPNGLKKLINAAHKKGLSVILDVVYNHLGPEGNYLCRYGPYFTGKYRTLWGDAINFDGPFSDEVRRFFINNALYWINEYHIDALRLDAVQGIFDFSARHFLEELQEAVHAQAKASGRNIHIIAESDLNDVKVINPVARGGYGLDAQWNDDFHHALHALITSETIGYYEDFGRVEHLGNALRDGFVYSGQYSRFRKRRHGNSSKERPARQFVVFSQSHDQVGNRMAGDRLSQTQPLEKLKLAAGVVLLSPYIPLLFMGEEYGETAPFQYFISHADTSLVEAVRKGRREEFASFRWEGEAPDPQAESTFIHSQLSIALRAQGNHRVLYEFYRELIRLRKELPALSNLNKEDMEIIIFEDKHALFVRRWVNSDEVFSLYNFAEDITRAELMLPEGIWNKILESSSKQWGGDNAIAMERIDSRGSGITISVNGHSFVLYRMIGQGR
ncbi:MAG: malto-oligosyltrehalose trehalohydrolase [Thermodesulfovibrionales bacterium]|jgi:maltooligosyltrehalose trehalohydrolase